MPTVRAAARQAIDRRVHERRRPQRIRVRAAHRWLGEVTDGAPTEHRGYDATLGLYPADLIAFLGDTQGHAWDKLVELVGSEQTASQLERVAAQLDSRGTIDILRGGLTEKGVPLQLAYFEPDLEVEPTARTRYEANLLRVVRQVRFDPKSGDSLDLVLFVNGVPTATAELKNRYTGQTVDDAIRQYREDPPHRTCCSGAAPSSTSRSTPSSPT